MEIRTARSCFVAIQCYECVLHVVEKIFYGEKKKRKRYVLVITVSINPDNRRYSFYADLHFAGDIAQPLRGLPYEDCK